MSICPICGKIISFAGAGPYDCRECRADFDKRNFMFQLPNGLKLDLFEYYDYIRMGEIFFSLRCGHLTPEEYDAEINKIVEEVNRRASPSPAKMAYEAKQRRSADYAQSLLRH